MKSGGSRDLPSRSMKIYQISRLVLSFVNPYHEFYSFIYFPQKGIPIPRIPSFFSHRALVFWKKNRLLNFTIQFWNVFVAQGYFKESKESLYIFNIYKCLWNLDQEKTCTVKGVLNQRIYKQYSLRAKITNACLDICLFLIFIVSHTELNRFGLVLQMKVLIFQGDEY